MKSAALNLHASTIRFEGQGAIIIGRSGTGKSGLALNLLALGAELVADDRTDVSLHGTQLIAEAPAAISGMIEARGVGLLNVAPAGPTALSLVIDLDKRETQRLPYPHSHDILGISLPCLHRVDAPHFAAAILLSLRWGISSAP